MLSFWSVFANDLNCLQPRRIWPKTRDSDYGSPIRLPKLSLRSERAVEMAANLRVWTVSEAKAGTLTQCLGVARLIDPKPRKLVIKRELPAWRSGLLSPYRLLRSPEPQVIISCGGLANSHARALSAACKVPPYTVHLALP